MEPKAGIEPATRALRMRCSTSELLRRSGLAMYRKLFRFVTQFLLLMIKISEGIAKILLASTRNLGFMPHA
jgi:hypothetical protein